MNKIVFGARGKINIENAIKKLKEFCSPCQIFDASVICGKEHILAACYHAEKAFKYKKNVAKTLDMEILLYVAGKRQINEAIKFAGAKDNGKYAFLFYGKSEEEAKAFIESLGLKIDDSLLESSIKKIKKFGITEKELKTVSKSKYADLVLERIAMLNIKK
ncbi:MAG: hypothetical protein J7K47_04075 [Thermoplasmata archaeon]|nr:hypothetical protein [Thermoplasmata archaeon]